MQYEHEVLNVVGAWRNHCKDRGRKGSMFGGGVHLCWNLS